MSDPLVPAAGRQAALAKLRDMRDKHRQWLDTLAVHNELAPYVIDGVETLEWVVATMESAPTEANGIDASHVLGQISWATSRADVIF